MSAVSLNDAIAHLTHHVHIHRGSNGALQHRRVVAVDALCRSDGLGGRCGFRVGKGNIFQFLVVAWGGLALWLVPASLFGIPSAIRRRTRRTRVCGRVAKRRKHALELCFRLDLILLHMRLCHERKDAWHPDLLAKAHEHDGQVREVGGKGQEKARTE